MIRVVARHYISDAKLEEFIRLSLQLVEATNKNDRGCISYRLFQDKNNPNAVAMIEEWESQEAADEHLKAKHFLDLVGPMVACCEKPSEIAYYNPLD